MFGILATLFGGCKDGVKSVDVKPSLLERYTVIDIRESYEWEERGVVKGAKLISLSQDDFVERVRKVVQNSQKPVALICRSGARTARAANILKAQGVEVTDLAGGMNLLESYGYEPVPALESVK